MSFIPAIPGPLFDKEVRVAGRRPSTYWVRGLYALGMLGLASLVFLANWEGGYWGAARRLQQLQSLAPTLTMTVVWFQFVAITLVSIIFSAPAVCNEKRAGTLGVLLATPLTARQIVLGKITALLVQLAVLALLSAPMLLTLRLLGGVTAEFVLASASLTLSSALLASVLGVAASTGVKRSPSAMVLAMALWALLQLGVPAALGILAATTTFQAPFAAYAVASAPLGLAHACFNLAGAGAVSPIFAQRIWPIAVASMALSAVIFLIATLRLRAAMRAEA